MTAALTWYAVGMAMIGLVFGEPALFAGGFVALCLMRIAYILEKRA